MKHTALIICLLLTTQLFGQYTESFPDQKRIKITGFSEMQLEPTSYVMEIMIRETYVQPREYNTEVYIDNPIDSIEKSLRRLISDLGFDKKSLTQVFVSSSTNDYNGKPY